MARGWVAVLVGAAAVLGYGAADAADVVPGVLTTGPAPAEPAPFPTPAAGPLVAPAVAPLAADAPAPAAAELAELVDRLRADDRLTGEVGVAVVAADGQSLLADDADTPRVPASTLKILTAAATLAALEPGTVLTTRTVLGPDGQVTLVGGGDVLLAAGAGDETAVDGRAGLGDLATETASALRSRGVTEVALALDDTLFTGPVHAPGWAGADLDFVMPVQPLAVATGRTATGYAADPARDAALLFAGALSGAGITVTGPVTRAAAPADADPLAEVSSAPVGALVRHALKTSDNSLTEVLARLVALERGKPADFTGAIAAVREELAAAGVDLTGVTMTDTSGLDTANRVPPAVIAEVLLTVAHPEAGPLHALLPALPVAGLDGTLGARLEGEAAGRVRAKTGTLTVASALAGTVVDADGRLLVFAALSDGLQVGTTQQARAALDSWAADLAACGCPGG